MKPRTLGISTHRVIACGPVLSCPVLSTLRITAHLFHTISVSIQPPPSSPAAAFTRHVVERS